jgi:hypothetical protein
MDGMEHTLVDLSAFSFVPRAVKALSEGNPTQALSKIFACQALATLPIETLHVPNTTKSAVRC